MPGENYDWKITLKKFFTGLFYAGAPFLVGYSIEFIEAETFPAEWAWLIAIVLAGLHALFNAIKHWDD